jgi:hypothetical protein
LCILAASRTTSVALGNGNQADFQTTRRRKTRSLLPFLHAKRESRFGFWNLQKSIANPGLQDDLHKALRNNNVPICGLAGAWVWEEGNHPGDGHAILWSGARGRTRAGRGYGVGLYLSDQVQACLRLRDTRAVSDRIFVARFSGTISLTTVVAYAPHAGRPAEERAVFFQQLERELDRVPKMDFQLVLGDFNSSAGKAATTREGGGDLGRHGLGRRNAAGEQLLQFCERSRLSVANTFFRHCAAQKATWRSLTGDYCGIPTSGGAGVHRLRAGQAPVAVQRAGRARIPQRQPLAAQRPPAPGVHAAPQAEAAHATLRAAPSTP